MKLVRYLNLYTSSNGVLANLNGHLIPRDKSRNDVKDESEAKE